MISPEDVAVYHAARPGITEDLLLRLADDEGRHPYRWLAEALDAAPPGVVVDLACGSAPLRDAVGGRPYVGLDVSAAELGRAARRRQGPGSGREAGSAPWLVRADVRRLPLARPVAAVTASMCLMLVAPLERVLAEVARVLDPGGLVAATVPSFDRTVGDPVVARVVAALGRPRVRYPETLDPATLPGRFRGAGLRLAADDTRVFRLPLPDAATARLLAASFYAPGADTGDRERAAAAVPVGPACTAAYPLRRLVAVRDTRGSKMLV